MYIYDLGNLFASSCHAVKEGYDKTAEWAISFFETVSAGLSSTLPSSQKIRTYSALTLASILTVGLPVASAALNVLQGNATEVHEDEDLQVLQDKPLEPTHLYGDVAKFINIIKIFEEYLGKKCNENVDIKYHVNGNPPSYTTKLHECMIKIPEYVHVDSELRSIGPHTFYSLAEYVVFTNCTIDREKIFQEGLKQGLALNTVILK